MNRTVIFSFDFQTIVREEKAQVSKLGMGISFAMN
jgi:hypothetical protein